MVRIEDFLFSLRWILDFRVKCPVGVARLAMKFLFACFGASIFDKVNATTTRTFVSHLDCNHEVIVHLSVIY